MTLSNQRAYQLRHKDQGKCHLCAKDICIYSKVFCEEHLIKNRERSRKYGKCKGRYASCNSYKIENAV